MNTKLLALSISLLICTFLSAATLSKDSDKLSLLIYNSNIALVQEQKELVLLKEENSILYENVAKSIVDESVRLELPPDIQIISQQFLFDKLTQERLLEAHLEKKVAVRRLKNAYEHEVISATLLAYNNTEAIVQTIAHQIINVSPSSVIFESVPREFATQPSLLWSVNAAKDIKTDAKLEYLIKNISYNVHYALYLDANSSNITGWISLENHSGRSFEDTKLSFLGGDINRVNQGVSPYKTTRAMTLADAQAELSNLAYRGYDLYTLPFKISLANNEKTQLRFMHQEHIATRKEYEVQMSNPLYLRGEQKSDVTQHLTLDSLNETLLGGLLRAYSLKDGMSIFLGESVVAHSPKEQAVKLPLGKNFELSATQTTLKRQESKLSISSDVLYTLTNHSGKEKTLTLLVAFNKESDSKVQTERDYSYTKGNFVTFKIHVAPNASEKFKVRYESKK